MTPSFQRMENQRYKEAINDTCNKWKYVMSEEMDSLYQIFSCDLAPLFKGNKAIGYTRLQEEGNNSFLGGEHYKSRIVAKGYNQKEGLI